MKLLLSSIFLLLLYFPLVGQSDFIKIQKIEIEGNKRTKEYIILRELDIAVGDTLPLEKVEERIQQNRNQLLNTALFVSVELKIENWNKKTGEAELHISLKENFPIFAYPWADLIDNDFNVWGDVYNYDLKRITPYIAFKHFNLTGQQDELTAYLQIGFTRKAQLKYTSPYLNKGQSLRATGNIFFSDEKAIRLNTFNNRDSFLTNENERLFKRFRLELGLNYRPALFEQHELNINYRNRSIADTIASLNPNYFFGGQTRQQFLSLSYRFTSDRRDFQLYARSGYYLEVGVSKEGLGIWKDRNAVVLDANFAKYLSFSPKWSLELSIAARTNLMRNTIDYYNLPVVGTKPEVVRGYITYHIRGSEFAYLKSSFRYQALDFNINFGELMPIKSYQKIPIQLYLKVNNDLAYVSNPNFEASNTLTDRWLYGRGIGIDILTANLVLTELMYNFNDLGDQKFSLHFYYSF